jgi:hypothetical protein
LIGWYATERRVATLSEVARRLRRDPSTLSVAISRYRTCRPELFHLAAMHDVGPLVPRESWGITAALTQAPNDDDRKTA